MGRIKDYLIWYFNTYGTEPQGPGLPHVHEYLLSLKPDESVVISGTDHDRLVQQAELVITSPSIRLVLNLQAQRLLIEDISWREFEELVAELLRADGYQVHLTKKTRDGGVDIIAEKNVPKIGAILSVWQAKKLKEGNRVGLRTIRELADTRNQLKASKGVIVTSTFLSGDAIKRIQADKYVLEAVQKNDLLAWIRDYKQST